MILLYAAGIIVGIISALVLNHTAFRGNPIPFVMELPNYRFPSAKSVFQLMWDKAKRFYPESVYRYFCGNDHYLVLTDL